MKRLAQQSEVKVPLRSKKERESLIACVTEVLKEESDDEVLESIWRVVTDLKRNVGIREALKGFHKNGWAFIQRAETPKNEDKLEKMISPSVLQPDSPTKRLTTRLDQEAHPMHNELVLKRVFEFCSVNDLKNIRLVSTKWRDLSLSSWRDKAVLYVDNVQWDDMEALLQDGSEFRKTPFKHYSLEFSHYFKTFIEEKLFVTFGPSIQYLEFITYECEAIIPMLLLMFKLPELRAFKLRFSLHVLLEQYNSVFSKRRGCPFQDLQPSTSNLRELELHMNANVWFEPGAHFPWARILENLPGLNCLRVKYGQERSDDINNIRMINLKEIIEAICNVRKERDYSILNLEELDIFHEQSLHSSSYRLDEDIAKKIVDSRLPLKRFSIDLGTNPDPYVISQLLGACEETLEYLKCNNGVNTNDLKNNLILLPLYPYLPTKKLLPNLQELVYVNGCVWAFHVLGFLDVPKLETLRIEGKMQLNKTAKKEPEQLDLKRIPLFSNSTVKFSCSATSYILPTLSTFFYDGPRNFSSEELQRLAIAMPNVTDLGIPVGNIETFPIVYELWPCLQSLHVLASDKTYLHFDDYAVTGLPMEDNKDVDDYLATGAESSRRPNITNLKELRKFVLETKLVDNFPRPRRALITDLSAVYGFLQLPKLRNLHLETLCRFSTKIKTALESHVVELEVKDPKPDTGSTDSDTDNPVEDMVSSENDYVSDSDDSSGW